MTLLVIPNDANGGQLVGLPVPGRSEPLLASVVDVPLAGSDDGQLQSLAPAMCNSNAGIIGTANLNAALTVPTKRLRLTQMQWVVGTGGSGFAGLLYRYNWTTFEYEFLAATAQVNAGANQPVVAPLLAPAIVQAGELIYLGIWAPAGSSLLGASGISSSATPFFRSWYKDVPTYAGALSNQTGVTGNVAALWVGAGS